MCRHSPIVRCALLLVVTYAAENQGNSTREDKQDDTMQYEPHVNFTTTWNHDQNSARDDEDSVQHEFHHNYMKNFDGVSSQHAPAELRSNFTKSDGGGNFTTSHEFRPRNNSIEENFKKCNGTTCIPICCELGYRMIRDICTPDDGDHIFPEVGEIGKKINEVFPLVVSDPCIFGRFTLDPSFYPDDEYIILVNGSVYQPQVDQIIDPTAYCFAVMNKSSYELIKCYDSKSPPIADILVIPGMPVGLILSLPFLLMTFVVYTVLPELWNMHGYTLRGYVASLFVGYIFVAPLQLTSPNKMPKKICIGSAFIIYFSFLASFFWLNVMCFDIWWTFCGFRTLQGSVKQRERKKFIIYSIYAWGCASILTILCAIMDFVPSVPETFTKPEFGKLQCWFTSDKAKTVYFYIPMSVTIICNICLFISTALKIVRHKKDTAHHLRGSESRRHDDNKQRFNLYLKLFIVMGINWSMEIMSWVFKSAPPAVWYISDLANALQGLIIFIIFVWKDKIKKLLLKRFGCQERGIFSRNSTRSASHSTTSRTCISTMGVMPLQEKVNPYVQTSCRAKNSSNETDCP